MNDWAEREFGLDAFDAAEYTHKVLATTAPANEDISQLIGRLTLAVDDVAGQIRSLVSRSRLGEGPRFKQIVGGSASRSASRSGSKCERDGGTFILCPTRNQRTYAILR